MPSDRGGMRAWQAWRSGFLSVLSCVCYVGFFVCASGCCPGGAAARGGSSGFAAWRGGALCDNAPFLCAALVMNVYPARYFYGLDGLRAVLMLVGVLWHAVNILSPISTFVYDSSLHESMGLFALVYPEHLFRMEAFFLVSGFLAQMVLWRKGKAAFWRARVRRVLLPLVLGCFGVNFLLQVFGSVFMGYLWSNFDMWRWVMHGWFLITLMMCAAVDMALPRVAMARAGFWGLALLAVVAVAGYAALDYWNANLWHFWDPVKGNLFNFFVLNTVQFYPCYAFGAWLFHRQGWLMRVDDRLLWRLGAPVAFVSLVMYLQGIRVDDFFGHAWWSPLAYRVAHLFSAMGIAFILFVLCYRQTRENGRVIRYLIPSAIVIYLVHHPLVVVFGWAFDVPALGNWGYFLLVTVVTVAASFACYEGIRRVHGLRVAFGLAPQAAG